MPVTGGFDSTSRASLPVCPSSLNCSFCQTYNTHRPCFIKYVATKVLKRLEMNKLRGAFKDPSRKLLLPLSFGVSSITMLQILDEQFHSHLRRNGHASYEFHLLHVDQSLISDCDRPIEVMSIIKERFSSHKFSTVTLEEVFDYDQSLIEQIDASQMLTIGESTTDHSAKLKRVLLALPSATSRADIVSILRLRLIVAFAKRHGCDAILYGDSTTRLAEKTLSEAAKGRGQSLPWLTADGTSPLGMRIIYPMRDLLKKELSEYASMISPPLNPLIVCNDRLAHVSVSSKTATIDDLMSQYFQSVEQQYPSIVANVVRTGSKLMIPTNSSDSSLCDICNLPIMKSAERWGGDQSGCELTLEDEGKPPLDQRTTCYGCARSLEKT